MKKTNSSQPRRVAAIRYSRLAAALALALPVCGVPAAFAQPALTPDAGAAQQPGISAATNGTPIVDIVAPNGAGVSHNKFTDYNVGPNGLILNNSTTSVQTQLGGRIDGNGQLGGSPARVILNEVTSGNPSVLNGATEIAGSAARLVVANPNGITADGASFINATRVTLGAGIPLFDKDGVVAGFDTRGRIVVEGKGLDARSVDRTDLVARAVRVNADVQAKKLVVVAADANVALDGNFQQTGKREPAAADAPEVVLDVSQLGSMHANAIKLVGNSTGVGVNIAGKVDVVAGDAAVTKTRGIVSGGQTIGDASNGGSEIVVVGPAANGQLSVVGPLTNSGTLHADRFDVTGTVRNSGTIRGDAGVGITGPVINESTARISSGGAIDVTGVVRNAGTMRSDTAVSVVGAVTNESSGRISSGGDVGVVGPIANHGVIEKFVRDESGESTTPPVEPPVVQPPVEPPVVVPPVVKPPVVKPPVVKPPQWEIPKVTLPAWMKPYVNGNTAKYVTFI
ncbi:hypothetical protein WJ32_32465 [Burkholderia ubonensis]|uniref:Filamentous haemagglutinin FhaB/tRNA nuclease CdiA-like TPS domain-containing protein n=1 Tax=Burkholderia ubonensis TaxID=101571 RepID=A0A118HWH1_9BURK|nr:hypothetical protein WJ32_32465 [Burkholderia ubonensis]KVG71958.1 hypothetical protein WJ33_20395 [Burkholderia ubonensis]